MGGRNRGKANQLPAFPRFQNVPDSADERPDRVKVALAKARAVVN